MRAKNEFRLISETYDTKLILERVVDDTLMCPKACCGAPVVECKCGPDCPHCNCFMIHKAMKEKGFTNKLLKTPTVVKEDASPSRALRMSGRKQPDPNERPEVTNWDDEYFKQQHGVSFKEYADNMQRQHKENQRRHGTVSGKPRHIIGKPGGHYKPGVDYDPGYVSQDVLDRRKGAYKRKKQQEAELAMGLATMVPGVGPAARGLKVVGGKAGPWIGKKFKDAYKWATSPQKATHKHMGNVKTGIPGHSVPAASTAGQVVQTPGYKVGAMIAGDRIADKSGVYDLPAKAITGAGDLAASGLNKLADKLEGGPPPKTGRTKPVPAPDEHGRVGPTIKRDQALHGKPAQKASDEEWGADDDPYGTLDAMVREFEQELDIQGDGIDTNVNELKDYVDIINGLDIDERQRSSALKYLKELRGPGGRAGLEDVDFDFVFGEEETDEQIRRRGGFGDKDDPEWQRQMDNRPPVSPEEWERLKNRKPKPQSYSKKHPKREDNEGHPAGGIRSFREKPPELDALAKAAFAQKDKIDLNKWRDYPAEDVMKAVYRRYGKELPSVDSYDWAITWDKKVRPWLKENEGKL